MEKLSDILLVLDTKNLNNRIYTTENINNILPELNKKEAIYGNGIGNGIGKHDHHFYVDNFVVKMDNDIGKNVLVGDIYVISDKLKNTMDAYVFRPYGTGVVDDDGVITLHSISSIFIITKEEDAFRDIIDK